MPIQYSRSTYPAAPIIKVDRQPGVAIIDDDAELTRAVGRILRTKYNCLVKGYPSLEAFLQALDDPSSQTFFESNLDLILLDFHLPGRDGPRLVRELAERRSSLLDRAHIMGITGDGEATIITQFRDEGIEEILQKPLGSPDFGNIAEKAYRICSGEESPRRPRPSIIAKYL